MMPPARVVLRAPNWLGDVVMAAPAFTAVRAAWPDARLDVAVPAPFVPMVEMIDGVDGGVPLGGKGVRGLAAQRADAERLRQGRYDLAILFTNSFGSAWVAKQAGIAERWGYRRDMRGPLLTRAIRPKATTRTSAHHADYYAALVHALGLPRPEPVVRLSIPEEVRASADVVLHEAGWDGHAPLLGCAPGAAYGTAKQWPPSYVAQVVAQWVAERDGVVVLVGAGADQPAVNEVVREAHALLPPASSGRLLDLTARTSLAQLAAVLARCTRVLANDSGAMHLAAAVGRPVVTVFGATNEHATAPLGPHRILTADVWCRPCLLRECPLDHRCMRRVSPEDVWDALTSDPAPRSSRGNPANSRACSATLSSAARQEPSRDASAGG
jgi:heptosyltransferase-2